MTPRSRSVRHFLSFVAVLLFVGGWVERGLAQAPSSLPSAPRVLGQRLPTTGGEVLQDAAAAEGELNRLQSQLTVPSDLDDLKKALGDDKSLKERVAAAQRRIAVTTRAAQLHDIAYRWQRDRQAASRVLARVDAHSKRMAGLRSKLDDLHARWSEIERVVAGRSASSEVKRRVEEILSTIATAQKTARTSESKVLDVQLRATETVETIDQVLGSVALAEPTIHVALVAGTPLWRAPMTRPDAIKPLQTAKADLALLAEFTTDARGGLIAQLLLFLLLVGVATRLGRRSKQRDSTPDVGLMAVSASPIAAAVLLTVLTTRIVHVATPTSVAILVDLLASAAAFRLVFACVPPAAQMAARLALSFVLVDIVRHVTHPWPLFDRLGLLVVMVVVAVLARATYERYRARASEPAAWPRWAAQAFAALAVTSVLANLLGYLVAAELASAAVLRGARLACISLVSYRLAVGMLSTLLDTRTARRLAVVREFRDLVFRRLRFLLVLVAVATWAWLELEILTLRDTALDTWAAVMGRQFDVGSLHIGVHQIVLLGVGVAFAFGSARLTRFVISEEVLPRLPLSEGGRYAASTTAGYVVLVLAFMAVLASVGFELGQLAFLAGALGVGIGFGLQNIVNNFVSGLILLFGRPVERGDVVSVGAVIGEVMRIGFRSSTIRTIDGAEIIVPNSELVANQVTNWTLTDSERRINVPIGVAYGSDVNKVRELLLEAAAMPSTALAHPPPVVVFSGFGDSSLDFIVYTWVPFDTWVAARSELCFAIAEVLAREHIQIPFPQRDLHVKSIDETAAGLLNPPR